MAGFKRRSVIGALASAGFIGLTGINPAAATRTDASGQRGGSGATGEIIGIELVDLQTGEREFYPSIHDIEHEKLTDSRYEVIEIAQTATGISERSTQQSTQTTQADTTVDNGVDLRVLAETETSYGHIDPDGSIRVWAGAVNRQNATDQGPASDVEVDVSLIDTTGSVMSEVTKSTNQDGYVIHEFDFNNAKTGGYRVEVTSKETDSIADEFFNVGPYTDLPFHWTGLAVGEETTLGVFSALGGSPESDVTREVTIDGPGDISEVRNIQFKNGIGWLSYTPSEPGDYWFAGEGIGAGELKALAPYFEIRDQYTDDGNNVMRWGAYVVDDKQPVANVDLDITLREDAFSDDGDVIQTFARTTNDFGQFTFEFEKPDQSINYQVDIQTADGRSVFLFGDRIFFEPLPPEASPTRVDFDVGLDAFSVAPGQETTLEINLSKDGEPVTNQSMTLVFSHTFNHVPAGSIEVQTDENGTVSQPFEIPTDAPDGERFYIKGITEIDGETYTAEGSASIEQLDIELPTFNLNRGETNSIDVSVTDRTSGDPVSDVEITIFGNRHNVDTETFDADYAQTDENGEGTLELTVPSDVTNDIMVNALTPYSNASNSGGSIKPPFGADINISPETPTRGETFTVTYTPNIDQDVSAFALFPGDNGADVQILRPGEEAQFEVPEYIVPGRSERVHLLMLATNGEAAEDREYIQIAKELSAAFSFSPVEPEVGETVLFEDLSTSGPDADIDTYEWDFDADSQIEATGQEVTREFDSAGDFDVTLTVTDKNGNTNSATKTISVVNPSPSVKDYTDENDVVQTTGLREAIEDWRSSEIDTGLLRDVIDFWRSGEQVN